MQHINTVNELYKLWICREACVCVTQDDRTSRNTYNSIHQFHQCYKLRKKAVLIHSGKVAFKLFCLNNKCDYPDSEKINEV